ncbi:(2Fe-2S)-binding protein [Flavimaricola marinus]|uniref:Nicotinate dehydrogenase subunit A n=1 Tax=Flavimaricola marinus TaxID=1819565 RepID=A0A238LE73_9RHOB|nr:2Fe-2S iron-sulfur cluster-binding protein [Flavimaricola marinus]SMY07695.1 Nicotinate dehydrogenase subunit A [Flavimaricola marinus]
MSWTDFELNGTAVRVTASPQTPLIYVLRNELGQTGTRFGCGQELCGACKVSVDGEMRFACTLPLSEVAGREVHTVEGMAEDPIGSALLAAFEAERAGQCGYCLSGILVRARALLGETPKPDRSAICAALDDHLCRCGAHPGIIRAVARAAYALEGRSA